MSHVAHQYSRVDFYSSLEVNLSLYYGGVGYDIGDKILIKCLFSSKVKTLVKDVF